LVIREKVVGNGISTETIDQPPGGESDAQDREVFRAREVDEVGHEGPRSEQFVESVDQAGWRSTPYLTLVAPRDPRCPCLHLDGEVDIDRCSEVGKAGRRLEVDSR